MPVDSLATGETPLGTAAEQLTFLLFLLVMGVSLGFVVHPWYEPVRDASIYVSTARSLLAGEGYSYLGVPFITRPPGFPLLLAPVIALFGTNFSALNLYVSLLGAIAAALFYRWMRPRLGWPPALAVALLLWFNPGFRRLSNEIMSDVPGLAAVLACLLVERWASRAPAWRRELALGLAIGLSLHVRSLSALLLPAIVLSRLALGRFYGQRSWRVGRAGEAPRRAGPRHPCRHCAVGAQESGGPAGPADGPGRGLQLRVGNVASGLRGSGFTGAAVEKRPRTGAEAGA